MKLNKDQPAIERKSDISEAEFVQDETIYEDDDIPLMIQPEEKYGTLFPSRRRNMKINHILSADTCKSY